VATALKELATQGRLVLPRESDAGEFCQPSGGNQMMQQCCPQAGHTTARVPEGAARRPETMPAQQDEEAERRTLAELVEGEYDFVRPRKGRVYRAVISNIHQDAVIVHLPETKRDGFVPAKDLGFLDDEYRDNLRVGDRVPVRVLKPAGRDGYTIVSIHQGLRHSDWLRAQDLLDSGKMFEAEVTGFNSGGVLVSFGRLQGFVPNSHLGRPGSYDPEYKAALVGKVLKLGVLEVNQGRRRLVLSQRAVRKQRRQQVLAEITEGNVRRGIVRRLVDFGAFVDLGGVDGLVHISELDWSYVEKPSDVLSVGDDVDVLILGVDRDRERISLSRKRVLPNPWDRVTDNLQKGDIVTGTITHLVPFGVFVDVGDGVEGLVPNSRMPDGEGAAPEVKPADEVMVRVLEINQAKRQIGLTIWDKVTAPGGR